MLNLLAIFHIIIIPLIIYLISKQTPYHLFIALILLLVSLIISLLEWIYLERKKHKESFLRPFADKLTVLSLLTYLVIAGMFSWRIMGLFIIRDLVVGLIRFRSARDNITIRGRWYGKFVTSCELGIILSILILDFSSYLKINLWTSTIKTVQITLVSLAITISIISIVHYLIVYSKKLHFERTKGKLVTSEKLLILVNQKSGAFRDAYRRHLLKLFAKRRHARVIVLPRNEDMFSEIKDKIKGYQYIIIAGGDGSLESAFNHQLFRTKCLGFFPLGAGNSYYSYFYKGKRFEYLRSRFKFKEISLDILELQFNSKKIETTFLSMGIDAEVIKQIKGIKDHTFADYFKAGAQVAFGTKQTYSLTCEVDGQKYEWNNCLNFIISKIPFIGYGLKSTLGEIKNDDEQILGLALVNTHSIFFNKGLRLWAMLLTQLGINRAPLVSLLGKQFTVRSDKEFSLQAGGEFLGYTKKFSVKVKRKQKVLVI